MESQIEPQAITAITIINPEFITTVIITTASWARDASISRRSQLALSALPMLIIKTPVINDDYHTTGTLTHNGVLIPRIQISNGDKVTLHHGNVVAVVTGDDSRLAIQSHLIVVLKRCELFVGDLQSALRDVVHLPWSRNTSESLRGTSNCRASEVAQFDLGGLNFGIQ